MAAPVGHILCAMALLHSGAVEISDPNAFYVGTMFTDIDKITDKIDRKITHRLGENNLAYIAKTNSSFEMGRRFHIFVDQQREKYMKDHKAYDFLSNSSYKTQMLKLIEDRILFDKLNTNISPIFEQIHPEELSYNIDIYDIKAWHNILKNYLDTSKYFILARYYGAAKAYKDAYGIPDKLFTTTKDRLKSLAYLMYAYAQIEWLSRNKKLRAIILGFYERKINELIKEAF